MYSVSTALIDWSVFKNLTLKIYVTERLGGSEGREVAQQPLGGLGWQRATVGGKLTHLR